MEKKEGARVIRKKRRQQMIQPRHGQGEEESGRVESCRSLEKKAFDERKRLKALRGAVG